MELLNIHRHKIKLRSSFETFPKNNNIKQVYNSQKPKPRLHNSKIWDTYRQIIQEKVNLSLKSQEHEDVELETSNVLTLVHHAVKKLPQTAIHKEQKITYHTKLRN
jgi:hypothetical protein